MKILAIIPARGGSKGVPMKNIKLLGEKPLLAYTSEAAKASKLLFKTIVSTDDVKIAWVARDLGVEVPFMRPPHLAQDGTPTIDVVIDVLKWYQNQKINFDAVCILQPTTPFRADGFIDAAIQKFIDSGADSLVSVLPVPHEYNPHWCFEIDKKDNLNIATGEPKIISRRQDLPNAYHRDGSIYVTKTATIINKNSLYGNSIAYIFSPQENYVNIDTEADWKKAEMLLKLFTTKNS